MTTAKKTTKAAAQKPAESTKAAAKKAAEPVEAAVAASKETVETVVKAGTDAATKGVEQAVAMGQEQVAAAVKAGSEAFQNYEDVVGFGKENIDAVMAANAVLVKGLQAINQEIFGIAKDSLEKNAAATKKIFACKSVEDVFAIQSDLVRASYDDAVVQSRKISDLTVKLAEDSAAPITKQVTVAVEKFTKPLAA